MSDRVNEAAGPWKYLYDDYDAGTVFITRDPQKSQTPLVAGLTIEQAAPIVAVLNAVLVAERATAAVDVERLRVAIRLAHDEIAATDRLSLAIDEPLLIATKYDEMTAGAKG